MTTINRMKAQAGKACDAAVKESNALHAASALATIVLNARQSKGAHAATLAGCIVGALVERGRAELAETMLHVLGNAADVRDATARPPSFV